MNGFQAKAVRGEARALGYPVDSYKLGSDIWSVTFWNEPVEHWVDFNRAQNRLRDEKKATEEMKLSAKMATGTIGVPQGTYNVRELQHRS